MEMNEKGISFRDVSHHFEESFRGAITFLDQVFVGTLYGSARTDSGTELAKTGEIGPEKVIEGSPRSVATQTSSPIKAQRGYRPFDSVSF